MVLGNVSSTLWTSAYRFLEGSILFSMLFNINPLGKVMDLGCGSLQYVDDTELLSQYSNGSQGHNESSEPVPRRDNGLNKSTQTEIQS